MIHFWRDLLRLLLCTISSVPQLGSQALRGKDLVDMIVPDTQLATTRQSIIFKTVFCEYTVDENFCSAQASILCCSSVGSWKRSKLNKDFCHFFRSSRCSNFACAFSSKESSSITEPDQQIQESCASSYNPGPSIPVTSVPVDVR